MANEAKYYGLIFLFFMPQEAAPHIPECGKRAAGWARGAGRAWVSRSGVVSVTSCFTNVSLSRFRTVDTWDSSDGSEGAFLMIL